MEINDGHINCYDPTTGVELYDGPFIGAVAIDTKGRGSVIFRPNGNDDLANIIIGGNCIIHYSDYHPYDKIK